MRVLLTSESAAEDEGFADFRTQLAIRRRAAAGHVGKGAKVVTGSDVAVVQRRMDTAAAGFNQRVEQVRVAEPGIVFQTGRALIHTPPPKLESTALPGSLHVAVDQRHTVAEHDGVILAAGDDGVNQLAIAPRHDVLQVTMDDLCAFTQADRRC
jgi:hypothetical protein